MTALPATASPVTLVTSGPRSSRAVALAFDDGWSRPACKRIARTLRAQRVKATFFINGSRLRESPAAWRRILRNMPVGNHTRSHPDLTRQAGSVIRRQLRTNEAIHERVLGRPMVKVFRPLFGASDARIRRIAGRLGDRYTVLWSISAADTSSASTVHSVIRRTTGARPGSIILMHRGPEETVRALPAVIRHYKARGTRMVGLDDLLGL